MKESHFAAIKSTSFLAYVMWIIFNQMAYAITEFALENGAIELNPMMVFFFQFDPVVIRAFQVALYLVVLLTFVLFIRWKFLGTLFFLSILLLGFALLDALWDLNILLQHAVLA